MIVRIGRGHIRPGTWDEYERAYQRLLVDGEKPRGLRTAPRRDVEDEHGGYTIAIWDDEAALAEVAREPYLRRNPGGDAPLLRGRLPGSHVRRARPRATRRRLSRARTEL